jgi:hypothetical protein
VKIASARLIKPSEVRHVDHVQHLH